MSEKYVAWLPLVKKVAVAIQRGCLGIASRWGCVQFTKNSAVLSSGGVVEVGMVPRIHRDKTDDLLSTGHSSSTPDKTSRIHSANQEGKL